MNADIAMSDDSELPSEDGAWAEPSLIQVEVTHIKQYGRNPRQCPNREYDRIKASIRTQGLDQPLVITQRPGESDYTLSAGGNTRLQILQELYEETADEQFGRVSCLYKVWTLESHVLLAHLRENELRDDLYFIDKARAVFDAKQIFESELSGYEISHRRLAKLISGRGLSLSHTMISKMAYAVERLWPLIPEALSAGIGKPQVQKIQVLERAARDLWRHRALGLDSEFSDVFAALCRRYDAADWDIHVLQAALENEMAEAAESGLQVIRMELEALIDGREFPEIILEPLAPLKSAGESEVTARADPDVQRDTKFDADTEGSDREPEALPIVEEPPLNGAITPLLPAVASDLATLRERAHKLAARLAQSNGLGDLIGPLPDQGMGFFLRDVPAADLAETLDSDLLGQVSTLWWHLAACAEMTVAPLESVLDHLDAEATLRTALEEQDAGLLFKGVWTLDPGQAGYQLWRQLSDSDWQDLLQLMDTYRALHSVSSETGTPLWA